MMGEGILLGNGNQFLSGLSFLQLPLSVGFITSIFCLVINMWMSPAADAAIWAGFLLFPLYFLIATVHSSKYTNGRKTSVSNADDSFLSSFSLYEEEKDDYNIVAQTV